MIKTTELRLNNIVSVNKGFEMYVSAIFKDTVYLDFEGNQGDVWEEKEEYVFPVILSEDYILKFGFEKKSWFTKGIVIECVYYQLNDFIVYLLPNSFEVELITKSGEQFNLYKNFKKEAHVLQNIYFSLTNEELTIKK